MSLGNSARLRMLATPGEASLCAAALVRYVLQGEKQRSVTRSAARVELPIRRLLSRQRSLRCKHYPIE